MERRGEWLDSDALTREERDRALDGLARVHTWTLAGPVLSRSLRDLPLATTRPRVLDIGAGDGDLSCRVLRRSPRGTCLALCDRQLAHLLRARQRRRGRWHVVADARALPFRDGGFSGCVSHLVWHHFDDEGNRACLDEMHRVARDGVLVVDLRPSALARRFFPLVARLLRLDPVSWEDGVISLAAAWPLERVRKVLPAGARYRLRRRFPFRWSLVVRDKT